MRSLPGRWIACLALAAFVGGCERFGEASSRPEMEPGSAAGDSRPAGAPDRAAGISPTPFPGGRVDIWIANGLVVDGTGSPGVLTDVLVSDGRIVHVGPVIAETLEAAQRIDAGGLVVAPGFVDAHAHGDPIESGAFHNFLAQGVTTIVLGQDGSSPPAGDFARHLAEIDAARPAVNVATLIGHNTIRAESGVGFAASDPAGRARMADLVASAMDAGAFGLSTGLEYTPGSRGDLDELVAIAEPVGERGGVVSSHMRNEDADRIEESLGELIAQGRGSGAPVHASHLKVVLGSDLEQAGRLLALMDSARAEGIRITADVYPYTASFTGLSILFPDWARPPSDYETVVRERRQELSEYLRVRVESRNGPAATLFGSGPWAGQTLAQVARSTGRPFPDILIELGPSGARAAYFVMDEDVMTRFLLDPFTAIASDGSPTMAHPRGYGSFARVLGRFVRDEGRLSLEEAVRKMTLLPASIYGLEREGEAETELNPGDRQAAVSPGDAPARENPPRGRIAPGWAADLAIFSLAEIRDPADFQNPHRLAGGMATVIVNGTVAWSVDGPAPGPGAGRALRFR